MLNLPPDKGLLLLGPSGIGKTYATCALIRRYLLQNFSVERISYPQLMLNLRRSFKLLYKDNSKNLLERYCLVDKLFIDDFDPIGPDLSPENPFDMKILMIILNTRLEHRLPFFICTESTLQNLERSFSRKVISRITSSCIIQPLAPKNKHNHISKHTYQSG